MVKVIQLIPRDGIGGVEEAARSMTRTSQGEFKFELMYIVKSSPERIAKGNVASLFRPENNPAAHAGVLRELCSAKADILVCSLWRSIPVGLCVKILRPDTKLVFFLHNATASHFLERLLSTVMLRFCDAAWADSKATLLSRVGSQARCTKRVISFVISSNPERRQNINLAPRFVFWGRLNHQKGLDRALKLISLLIEKGYPATYEIWGPDGGERSSLDIEIHRAGMNKRVMLKGPLQRNLLNQVAQENCFYLQLSRNEGMAMSVVEAMQRSLVPVVTPVGEVAQYCRHNVNAIVVNNPDDPAEAVNEIVSLLQSESKYRQLQNSAYDQWSQHILYRDDIYAAARELCD